MSMTKPTSEQVTFLAAGTGAQQRTSLDKMRETVSVKDFGAVGDGVADDTAAIQAAIVATANKSLFLPAGTYLVSSSISIASPMLVFGDGIGATIIKVSPLYSGANAVVSINGTSSVTMRDLEIDGNQPANAGTNHILVVIGSSLATTNVVLECVRIANAGYTGIVVAGNASFVTIDKCRLESNGTLNGGNNNGSNIYASGADNLLVTNSLLYDSWEHGAYIDASTNVSFVECRVLDNCRKPASSGLSYRSSYGIIDSCVISGSGIVGGNSGAIGILTSSPATTTRNVIVVSNNVMYGNTSSNAEMNAINVSGLVVVGNIFGYPSAADGNNIPDRAIRLQGDKVGVRIANNVMNRYVYGMEISRSGAISASDLVDVSICDNVIRACISFGMDFNDDLVGNGLQVNGNYIQGPTFGVRLASASANVSNVDVRNNQFVGVSVPVQNASVGTPLYMEAADRVASASVTGSTVSAGATVVVSVAITGLLNPTFVTGSPSTALPSGLVWNVSRPASSSNTADISITNITGSPIAFSTATWTFACTLAIVA